MEHDNTINQFVAEMQGFTDDNNILVMGTTNFRDKLDNAILDRFEIEIPISLPNMETRKAILELTLKKIPEKFLDPAINLAELSLLTEGFNARNLTDMINTTNRAAVSRKQDGSKLMHKQLVEYIEKEKKDRRKIVSPLLPLFIKESKQESD